LGARNGWGQPFYTVNLAILVLRQLAEDLESQGKM